MNKIYVATHKPFTPPADSLYVPIQVNAASQPSLGFCKDSTGENISAKNHLYGELTALYWIWKNEKEADYIGLCHYRRFFLNQNKTMLTSSDCDEIFENYDIILPYQTICPGMNYYEMYQASHNIEDVKIIESVIARLYPEYLADYRDAIHGNLYYMGNLFVTSRELFFSYAEWLFTIFAEAEKFIDTSTYDSYHARVYGFLSEQMLMAWVKHQHLRICECEVAITSAKAEIRELMNTMQHYLQQNQIDQAVSFYLDTLKKRPDLRFEQSDIHGYLPDLELALDILGSENAQHIEGLCQSASDLPALLKKVQRTRQSIQDALSAKDASFLSGLAADSISWVMAERILEKCYPEREQLLTALNQLGMLFISCGMTLEGLQLLQYALTLSPSHSTTLRHISVVCSELNPKRGSMNIAIATNRRYVPVSLVMLHSLFSNNTDTDITVYVLHCELTKEDNAQFQKLAQAWHQQIVLVPLTDLSIFQGLPTTDAWTKEAYFRLLMPTLLPDTVERILYLDVDTIVNKSIWDFYRTDFKGMDFVVCEDIYLNRVHKGYYQENFAEMRDREFTYFNSGVMLWNMKNIRNHYTFQIYRDKILEYMYVLQCMDQDILNVVHCGKTLTADWRQYNLLIPTAIQNHFSCEDVKAVSCIIHFLGPKPWNPDVAFQPLYQIWKDYEQLYLSDSLE